MAGATIKINSDLRKQLERIKEGMDFSSIGDAVSFLLDLFIGMPSMVPISEYKEMREKYVLDYPQEFFETALELKGIMDSQEYKRKFDDLMAKRINESDAFFAKGLIFECHHCGNVWRYSGSGDLIAPIFIKCPSCLYRVSRKDARELKPL